MPTTADDATAPCLDEVDRIIQGWERARSDLDIEPLAVFSRISRLARYLETARRESFAAAGLEGWEFDMLSALRRSGDDALSPGALMHQTLVTSGTMTTRIDKLVARGLVSKNRSPRDGRAVEVRLQPDGVSRVDTAMESLLSAERRLLQPLSAQGQSALASTLRSLLLTFEADES
ncbi:MarR family winged helix-turn-helix transcriptional regulator [Brachybacterium alimentarium]|uniref:MarR family transcriptional regulator n=1 Tax=Brachybacterium alimentarium TaxID=47845 RepID=A0A2A3YK59_9MICO|nr:MarR family winged helix-turn-helix transcriptional regulator [Brachybacterium alimentarium]PCC39671.1 MarR family transcriptional regulator [Brachybacterium alimentarium]RCS64117.1 MarR family transcriptional regulator [Brachybacterium alimentarium]RCS79678.1 MarR family transcriptional regulator [Brachybacterium alimentarium]